MKPIEAFLDVFGNITIGQVIVWGLAILFIIKAGKEISKWFDEKHRREEERLKLEIEKDNRDKQRDADVKTCLDAISKFDVFIESSERIHKTFVDEISEVKKKLEKSEEDTKKREMNKNRNTLLQLYRHHTNLETNPNQTWTKLDADTFWALAGDYEKDGGNGEMHNEVFPAMRKLRIIDEK